MRSANYKIVNTKNLDIIKLVPFSSLQHLALISKVSLSQHSSYQQKRTSVCFVKLSAEINCILETCHSDEITSRKHWIWTRHTWKIPRMDARGRTMNINFCLLSLILELTLLGTSPTEGFCPKYQTASPPLHDESENAARFPRCLMGNYAWAVRVFARLFIFIFKKSRNSTSQPG